jgi:hypothetical protein
MRYAQRLTGLLYLTVFVVGCRDAVQPAGLHPYPGRSFALGGTSGPPVLYFSTYLGGADDDDGANIAVDADGYAYVTGETASLDFPATAGAFRATNGGVNDVVVTKLDPAGSAVVYSTYLGGTAADAGVGITLDAARNAYITGKTASTDFPTTAGAFQAVAPGRLGNAYAAFVSKLDPSGSAVLYSTYVAGTTNDEGGGIAVDGAGNAYVVGVTSSRDFPITTGALQTIRAGNTDAFVSALNPSGTALLYSTYLGGGSNETGTGIAVDADGHAYVTGRTTSPDLPTTPGAFQRTKVTGTTIHAAFVTKVNPSGTAAVYSTYLAGTGSDRADAIALDAPTNPHVYVTGRTSSADFPTTPGAFQRSFAGLRDGFVTKLDPSGSALVYSTYLGGADEDENGDIAVDAAGNAYVAGLTLSTNFPITAGAVQPTAAGLSDAFVAQLDASGSTLVYSTYLGGTSDDENVGVAVDPTGSVYAVGTTESLNFPTTAGAFDRTYNGGADDIFVVRIADFGQPATLTLAPAAASAAVNTQHCVSATVQDAAANGVPGVIVRFAVTGAHSAGGSVKTDAGGQAAFCYTGTQAGEDTVTGVGDTNGSGVQDPGEPSNTATKTWVVG